MQITPYINFPGNCRQALTFYHDCLGGELELQTVGNSPISGVCEGAMQDQILHGALTRGSMMLMGSDMVGPDGLRMGNNMAISLTCSTEEEIERIFGMLVSGGVVIQALRREFWGAQFGVVTDKFGIRWMLTYDERFAHIE